MTPITTKGRYELKSPATIPNDWYARAFDSRYFEVDTSRKPDSVTIDEVKILCSLIGCKTDQRILDLCCGYGRHAVEFAKLGNKVVGLDLSTTLLTYARERASRERVNIDLILADLRRPPAGPFDVVMCMHTSLGYLPVLDDDLAILSGIYRVLKPGGFLCIHQIDPEDMGAIDSCADEHMMLSDGTLFTKRSNFDPSGPLWWGAYYYDHPSGTTESLPFVIRLYTRLQYQQMLILAGFSKTDIGVATHRHRSYLGSGYVSSSFFFAKKRRGRC